MATRSVWQGSGGPSRASRIGEAFGGGMAAAFIPAVQEERQNMLMSQRFDPIRESLMQSAAGMPAGPMADTLRAITSSPSAFAQLMQDPQQLMAVNTMAQMAQPEVPEAQTFARVVSGDSELNERLGLGIPKGQTARVELTRTPGGGLEANVLGAFGGQGATVNIDQRGPTAEAEALGRLAVETVQKVRENAASASRDLNLLARQRSAIESGAFQPGALAETRLGISRLLELVNIDPASVPGDFLGASSVAEMIDAVSNDLATSAAERLSRVTNMSLQMARDSVPNLLRTAEGNMLLIDALERDALNAMEEQRITENFLREHGTTMPPGQDSLEQVLMAHRLQVREDSSDLAERIERIGRVERRSIEEATGRAPRGFRTVGEVNRASESELTDYFLSLTPEQFQALRPEIRQRIITRLGLE